MDFDTAILLALTTCAYGWFLSFGFIEEKREAKAREQEKIVQLQRDERLRKLFGKN